ncbi:hypothetical protein PPTG_24648 [Phytophthora nicotianae INRA-310]|uniref:Uncharacterized protein n=1 Tax=Phytophthora nicotianae (strain INRA-310) TaxID=761204 RepID=W2PBB8_PHYN3|nr:hypothetical protein PPTG_24648 [Phytophthora nicotianae INRA-310]ETM98337.1 hypothetical protein PPTG_24648 [Phytophthora nicotianae INRA-310]
MDELLEHVSSQGIVSAPIEESFKPMGGLAKEI